MEPDYKLNSLKKLRQKNGHVSVACTNCKASHLKCDEQRPCSRCVNSGKADCCKDSDHRKRGRPRMDDCMDGGELPIYKKIQRQCSENESISAKSLSGALSVRSLLSGSDVSSQSSSSSARSALADDAGSRSPKKLDTMSLYIKDESLMQNQQLSVGYVAVDTSSAAPIIPTDVITPVGWEIFLDHQLMLMSLDKASFIGYSFEDVVHRIQLPSLTHYADHGNLFAALNTAQQTGSCVFLNAHLRNGAGHHQLYSLTAHAQNNGFRVQVQSYVHPRLLDLDQCGILHQEQPLTMHAPYKTTCFSVPQSVPLMF
ncbi:hypothetical protein MP228_002723 [Amoeboaphelidium protococcarum]|nr:hypothetical protein MP228_002723 [Amoeboaphelidium protococcarum]